MKKSIVCALSVAAVLGAALTSTAASAAVTAKSAPAAGDPDTAVTFSVTSGLLAMTAPTAANLGSGAPDTTITGPVGTTAVTDDRAALAASWTAVASSTAFTTGGATLAETIPAGDIGYAPGAITTTGTITSAGFTVTLSGTAQTVVTGTAGIGDNSASWDPTLAVAVPSAGVVGLYSGTLTQSVS